MHLAAEQRCQIHVESDEVCSPTVRLNAHFQYAPKKKKAKMISHTVLDYSTTQRNFGELKRGLERMHVHHQQSLAAPKCKPSTLLLHL